VEKSISTIYSLADRFQQLINRISNIGIEKENDSELHDLISYSNVLAFSNFIALFIVSVLLFLFIDNFVCAFYTFICSILQPIAFYFNHKGKSLLARIYLFVLTNSLTVIASILFSHNTILDTYFIVICMTPIMMFSYKEIKWMVVIYIFSFINLLIEYTPLENYLPAFHLVKVTPALNYSLLAGLVLLIINQVGVYAYIQRRTQNRLLSLNNHLKAAQIELEGYSKDLELFGITATHDLKAPILTARDRSRLIEQYLNEEKVDRVKIGENIEAITASFNEMETLIDSYLSYIKVLQFNANKNKFFVIKELDMISKMLQSNFPNAHIVLPESDVMIESNKNLFKTVMQNLIQNGLKFNHASLPTVTIKILQNNEYIQFVISDNGFGINAQFKSELFLPFKRFNKEMEGSGLGLTISKRIAQKMNGNLYCAKTDEQGTTFILELPITR